MLCLFNPILTTTTTTILRQRSRILNLPLKLPQRPNFTRHEQSANQSIHHPDGHADGAHQDQQEGSVGVGARDEPDADETRDAGEEPEEEVAEAEDALEGFARRVGVD